MRAPCVPSTANVVLPNSKTCRLPRTMGGTSIGVAASDAPRSAVASLAASEGPASGAPPAPLDPAAPPVPVADGPPALPEPFDPAVPPDAPVLLELVDEPLETLPAEPAEPDAEG